MPAPDQCMCLDRHCLCRHSRCRTKHSAWQEHTGTSTPPYKHPKGCHACRSKAQMTLVQERACCVAQTIDRMHRLLVCSWPHSTHPEQDANRTTHTNQHETRHQRTERQHVQEVLHLQLHLCLLDSVCVPLAANPTSTAQNPSTPRV